MGTKRASAEFGSILYLLFPGKPFCSDILPRAQAPSEYVLLSSGWWRMVWINTISLNSQPIRTGACVCMLWWVVWDPGVLIFILDITCKVFVQHAAVKKRKWCSCILGWLSFQEADLIIHQSSIHRHACLLGPLDEVRRAVVSSDVIEVLPTVIWGAKVWRWAPLSIKMVSSELHCPCQWHFRYFFGFVWLLILSYASPSAGWLDRVLPRPLALESTCGSSPVLFSTAGWYQRRAWSVGLREECTHLEWEHIKEFLQILDHWSLNYVDYLTSRQAAKWSWENHGMWPVKSDFHRLS